MTDEGERGRRVKKCTALIGERFDEDLRSLQKSRGGTSFLEALLPMTKIKHDHPLPVVARTPPQICAPNWVSTMPSQIDANFRESAHAHTLSPQLLLAPRLILHSLG